MNTYKKALSPTMRFFSTYQWRDVKRQKFHFMLTFCSVFVIVLSTLTVTSMIEKTPVIFWKFAQTNHGEMDAIITPG